MQRNSPSKLSSCVILVLVVFGILAFGLNGNSQITGGGTTLSSLDNCVNRILSQNSSPTKQDVQNAYTDCEEITGKTKKCEDRAAGLKISVKQYTDACADSFGASTSGLNSSCKFHLDKCSTAVTALVDAIGSDDQQACNELYEKKENLVCFVGGKGQADSVTKSEKEAAKQEVKDARQRVTDLQKEARADKKDAQTASTNAEKGGTDAQNSFTDAQSKIRDEERKALKDASASLREAYVKARAEYDAIDKEYIQMRDNIRKWEDGVSDAQSARFIQCTNYAQERWMLEERKREELDARVRGAMAQRAFNVGSLSQLSGYAKTLSRSKVNRRNKNWYIFMNECLNGNVGIAKTEKDRVRKAEAALIRERAGAIDKEAYLEKRRSNAMDDVKNAGVENEQAKKDALQKTAEDTAAAQKKLATSLEAAQKQKNEQLIKQIQDAMAGVQGKGTGPEAELKDAKNELKDAEKKARSASDPGSACLSKAKRAVGTDNAGLTKDGKMTIAAREYRNANGYCGAILAEKGAKRCDAAVAICEANGLGGEIVASPPTKTGGPSATGTTTSPNVVPRSGNSNGSR
jgi:hypothetical protein